MTTAAIIPARKVIIEESVSILFDAANRIPYPNAASSLLTSKKNAERTKISSPSAPLPKPKRPTARPAFPAFAAGEARGVRRRRIASQLPTTLVEDDLPRLYDHLAVSLPLHRRPVVLLPVAAKRGLDLLVPVQDRLLIRVLTRNPPDLRRTSRCSSYFPLLLAPVGLPDGWFRVPLSLGFGPVRYALLASETTLSPRLFDVNAASPPRSGKCSIAPTTCGHRHAPRSHWPPPGQQVPLRSLPKYPKP